MLKICWAGEEDEEVGQEQLGGVGEDREAKRKKKKMAATASERTRTGTVMTIPFGVDG